MNKLSKIALVSSLSILSGVIVVHQTVIAQEDSNVPSQETSDRERGINMGMERTAPPSRSRENPRIQRQNTENPSTQTRDRNSNIPESSMNQRVNTQDNRLSNPATIKAEEREQRIKERCETINAKIANHKEQFQIKSQNRIEKYNKLISRLELISQKLAEREVDVTEYNSYIEEFTSKVETLNLDIQSYVQNSQLESANICSNQKPSDLISTKKESLQTIITQDRVLRSYIKDTIIPYLRSVTPQKETIAPSPTESPVTSPTNSNQVLE